MYRLLIADDEENIRHGIARSLPWQEWGYEVCAVCANGQEVLDQLDACRPDVVLSDIRMPGMDGMELMQRLNRDHPEIKIVILKSHRVPAGAAEGGPRPAARHPVGGHQQSVYRT